MHGETVSKSGPRRTTADHKLYKEATSLIALACKGAKTPTCKTKSKQPDKSRNFLVSRGGRGPRFSTEFKH